MDTKIYRSHRAIRRYVLGRWDHPQPAKDPDEIHVVFNIDPKRDEMLDIWGIPAQMTEPMYFEDGDYLRAACGAKVRVILTTRFDTEESKACERCSQLALIWQTDAQECMNEILAEREKRRERERKKSEREQMLRDLEEYHATQERDLERKKKPSDRREAG